MKIVPATAQINGSELTITVPLLPEAIEARCARSTIEKILHEGRAVAGPDFASVVWHGRKFSFSARQAIVVAELWNARQHGYEYVTAAHLLAEADSNADSIRDLFRKHPAWGTLILSARQFGGPAGTFKLADGPV